MILILLLMMAGPNKLRAGTDYGPKTVIPLAVSGAMVMMLRIFPSSSMGKGPRVFFQASFGLAAGLFAGTGVANMGFGRGV